MGLFSWLFGESAKQRKIEDVDSMDGHDFEHWCASLLRDNGFSRVSVTQGSGDNGVDIIAWNGNTKYAIQCKRYSGKLGNTPVQEVYTGKAVYGCTAAAVMTNNYFTDGAVTSARATGVELWDRDTLNRMLRGSNKEHGKQNKMFEQESKRLQQSGVEKYDLWPHNQYAKEIDAEYYRNLPHVGYEDGMKEYILMYYDDPIFSDDPHLYGSEAIENSIVSLVSEQLSSPYEAEIFAKSVEKHCCGITQSRDNIVYGKFHLYSIAENWREEYHAFEFANWA